MERIVAMHRRSITSWLIKFVVLMWAVHAGASTIITPAGLVTAALENAISAHLEGGGKVQDITSAKLAPRLNIETLNRVAKGNLWSRFQLVAAANVQNPESKDRVLAVTSFRVSEDRRPIIGRYVVWMHASASPPAWEQRVWSSWESEDKISALFQSSGVALEDKGIWQQGNTKLLEGMPWSIIVVAIAAAIVLLWLLRKTLNNTV